ncbi:MAG TPA: hypothetical protein VFY13_04130, partial [Luteolibacter sp.]|nr:hypothetical protein [Luteolibacter sp.]
MIASCCAVADELPLLHPLFSDHAVLQRGRAVPVWGWAKAGATIRIRFADQERTAKAAADGRWACQLEPLEASAVGRNLTVDVEGTEQRMEVKDLLVGDVWLCSGQSNMEMNLFRCREEQEIASAHDNGIRLLTIPKRRAYLPQRIFTGAWKACSPDALREDGGFSAAAYFFGKKLREELGVPVGLIHASLGGTVAEAWTGAAAFGAFPEFAPMLQELQTVAQSKAADPEVEYLDAWFRKHDPGTAKGWQRADADTTAWREVRMPGNWGDCGIKGFEGIVWLQRRMELPEAWVGKRLVVNLGAIADNDTAWINDREIGRTNGFDLPRCYEVAAGVAKAGGNVLSLRVTNFG